MRRSRAALLLAIALVLAVAGCTTKVAGTATRDPAQPPLKVSEDGYGIEAGFDDAPTRIEIFTEPQCGHCADLQADFGDQFAYYIGVGALKITYRPLTFLDDARYNDETGSALDPWARRVTPTYLNFRKASIYGGSNEVQRQIISRTILGL